MSKRPAGMITRCRPCPSVIDAAKLWHAGAIRHPGRFLVRLRPAEGRILVLRAGLAGVASAALAVTCFAAPAQAKVFALGGQAAGRAFPAAAPGSGWSITPSPNPRAGNGALSAVSCPTTSACTAVGLHVRESGLGVTLAERRSGGVWTVQPTPNPRGAASSALNGVSCSSGSMCTGVGQFVVGSGAQLTLAEQWNGSTWHIQPTPDPVGSGSSRLSAVVCPAADSCTAVGSSNSQLLVERRGGGRWRIQSAPVPPGAQFSELNGVTCTAANSCIAVGDFVNSSGADVTLAERWNGSNWAIQPTPNPSGARSFSVLTGVSCTARDACVASGAWDAGAFAERWNGTSWSVQAVPNPAGAQFAQLFGVSCADSSCEAVGGYVDSSGAFVTLGERWNGTAWQPQPTPNPARANSNYLGGVSCSSASDCTAVGQGNGAGTPITLGEQWEDDGWRLQAVPSPVGAAENQLNGIACPATDRCVAVGTAGPTRGVWSTEAVWWNGRTWHLQRIPTLPGAGLNAVACAWKADCVAVGASNAGTLAERWNGETWTIQPTPNPPGSAGGSLNGVACTSASFCVAVGGRLDSAGNQVATLAERWNGKSWAIQPTPNPAPGSILGGVTCTSASFCLAVGGGPAGTRTLVERWNGRSWAIQRTPNPSPGGGLGSVSCTSAVACTAVEALQGTSSSGPATLAERWNGTRWTVQPTPTTGSPGSLFNTVACTSASSCTAVGALTDSFGNAVVGTLAERWNGVQWHIEPTPVLPALGLVNNFSAACPAESTCIAAGGFENDGPGAKTLTEVWRAGASAAQPAPGAFSPGAYRGIAGCIRAAMDERFATETAATRIAPKIEVTLPKRSQPASEIERIASLCRTP
jgi:hypothetical protein